VKERSKKKKKEEGKKRRERASLILSHFLFLDWNSPIRKGGKKKGKGGEKGKKVKCDLLPPHRHGLLSLSPYDGERRREKRKKEKEKEGREKDYCHYEGL